MRRSWMAGALGALALAACESAGQGGATGMQDQPMGGFGLQGASASELRQCAGDPEEIARSVTEGVDETWSYTTDGPAGFCRAQFTIRDDEVATLRYTGRSNNDLADLSACQPIVGDCP